MRESTVSDESQMGLKWERYVTKIRDKEAA